jgi:hypothetical protein
MLGMKKYQQATRRPKSPSSLGQRANHRRGRYLFLEGGVMKFYTLVTILIFIALQGCATKQYGRQGQLTAYEKETMTCREIGLEMAKVRGFIDHVNKESEFSGRDVLAILGDFGIGNSMERSAAIESANNRLDSLRDLKSSKKCADTPS